MTNKLQQTFVVNADLKMGKGKIAAQVAHGTTEYMICMIEAMDNPSENYEFVSNFRQWIGVDVMKKVVLKATEAEMETILSEHEHDVMLWKITDCGFTQVKENSFTCIASEPITKDDSDKIFGHLKLL